MAGVLHWVTRNEWAAMQNARRHKIESRRGQPPAWVALGPDGLAPSFYSNLSRERYYVDGEEAFGWRGLLAAANGTFSRASDGSRYDASPKLVIAGPNVLRLTHDPVTGKALGALLEGSATQLFAYPKGNGGFGSTPVYTANALVAPNGLQEATRIDAVAGDPSRYEYAIAGGTYPSGQVLTIQWHQRRINYSGSGWATAPGSFLAIQNFINAAYVPGSCKKVSDLPGGWEHWTAQVTITDGALASTIRMYIGGNGFTGGTVTDPTPFAFWGINIVAAPFRSSIIMQQGIRLADSLSFARAGTPEGTVVIRGRTAPGVGSAAQFVWQWDDGTGSNRYQLYRNIDRTMLFIVRVGGSTVVSIGLPAVPDNTDFSVAPSFKVGQFAASLNGAAAVVNTGYSGPLPNVSRIVPGSNHTSGNESNGTIADLRLYPKAYDPAELPGMSAL